jgi:hypothetical protein
LASDESSRQRLDNNVEPEDFFSPLDEAVEGVEE